MGQASSLSIHAKSRAFVDRLEVAAFGVGIHPEGHSVYTLGNSQMYHLVIYAPKSVSWGWPGLPVPSHVEGSEVEGGSESAVARGVRL